jgi:hypothetical protein
MARIRILLAPASARISTGAHRSRIRRAQACFGSAAGNECRARWRKHPLVYPLVSAESHRSLRLLRRGVIPWGSGPVRAAAAVGRAAAAVWWGLPRPAGVPTGRISIGAAGGVGYRELKIPYSNCCNLYWEQTTAGDGKRDAGTEPGSSTVDVYPPSERLRTGSGGEGSGGEGLATVGRGGVDGEEAERLPLLERYTIPKTVQNSCWRLSLLAL